ncbi:vancomycin high temperature exclusion protein [mine drainage metagenome]|uniref:Vancomycin high temperature exclusion protein n=1 Tax=mine drainage metagenome TaxID=410659 RepID=A0A1J5SMW3_9ZZZZ
MVKKIILPICVIIFFAFVCIFICNSKIESAAKGKLYNSVDSISFNKVGLLLGTSKFMTGGGVNPYYSYRIEAATELFRAKKIKYLIISGDNSTKFYDEPTQMKKDLIAEGIDSSRLFLDYAGFRTFDSMIRLKEIFGQDSVTIISQKFHNERALFIAEKENIVAVGFNAKDVNQTMGVKVQAREKLARVKVFVDYLVGKKPHFLGNKISIPE